jgi:hypothetical protein
MKRNRSSTPKGEPNVIDTQSKLPDPHAADPHAETASPAAAIDREAIARLAYSYWEARGCVGGSPEEDWIRAEQELRMRQA